MGINQDDQIIINELAREDQTIDLTRYGHSKEDIMIIDAKPTPPPVKKIVVEPWSKAMLPGQGPKINGSVLEYTTSSDKSIKMPEARS